MCGAVAQLVRASVCHAEGHGFESRQPRQLNLASKNKRNALEEIRGHFSFNQILDKATHNHSHVLSPCADLLRHEELISFF